MKRVHEGNTRWSSEFEPARDAEEPPGELRRSAAPVASIEAATRLVTDAFVRQVDESAGAAPNAAIPGDSGARNAFLCLLTNEAQRAVFVDVMRDPRAWARARSLVGAPPFHFLRPNDAGMLNAGGFAANRVHMAQEGGSLGIPPYQTFGPGQLRDELGRTYRAARRGEYSSPPWRLEGDVALHVRVKKRSTREKVRLLREGGSAKDALLFHPTTSPLFRVVRRTRVRDGAGVWQRASYG